MTFASEDNCARILGQAVSKTVMGWFGPASPDDSHESRMKPLRDYTRLRLRSGQSISAAAVVRRNDEGSGTNSKVRLSMAKFSP